MSKLVQEAAADLQDLAGCQNITEMTVSLTHIEVYGQPVLLSFRADDIVSVPRLQVADVIPAITRPCEELQKKPVDDNLREVILHILNTACCVGPCSELETERKLHGNGV